MTDGTLCDVGVPVRDVTIADNMLIENGTGFGTEAGQCFSTPEAPGDCGETIHLVSVTDSIVEGNCVVNNVGGILLTDEFGPRRATSFATTSRSTTPTTAGSRSPVTARRRSIR